MAPTTVAHRCIDNSDFLAVLYDDVCDSSFHCHTTALNNTHRSLTLDSESFQVEDVPVPMAHSTPRKTAAPEQETCHGETLLGAPSPAPLATSPPLDDGLRALKVGPFEFAEHLAELWPSVNPMISEPCDHLLIYKAVRKTNLPNYISARIQIPSQINCNAWDTLLKDYHDCEITDFLRFGWPGGYTALSPPTPSQSNHPSACNFSTHIDKFLEKETSLGAMIGPFSCPPFKEWSQVSPLMTVEKKDSSSRRVIIDLSFPVGHGVNSGVPRNYFQGNDRQYTLPTIHDLARLIVAKGQGAFLWKADLERAYRQLRSDPLDYPLMGVQHNGQYFTDICPSFGCRGSGAAQQRVSEAVCYLMSNQGHPVLAYVDDFCGINSSFSDAVSAFATFEGLCSTLGLKLASDKSAFPAQRMEWLGFHFDTINMQITVPMSKLLEVQELAATWSVKTRATRRDLQKLAGKLNHISQCVLPARKFMARILRLLRTAPAWGTVPVDAGLRKDVLWFTNYAKHCNGRLLLRENLPSFNIQCDACPEGGGGFSDTQYYSTRFDDDMAKSYHISQIEALNIVLAIKTLVPADLRSAELVITTDNSAAMHTLNTGKTRDPVLSACSRELWLFAALRELSVTVNHAPGATLVLADALSRRHKSGEYQDLVTQMTRQLNLLPVAPYCIDNVLTPEL